MGGAGSFRQMVLHAARLPDSLWPRYNRHTGVGVAVANAQGCRAGDDAAPTPFTANLWGAGGLGQTAHRSVVLSGRGLPDECDAERFGQ